MVPKHIWGLITKLLIHETTKKVVFGATVGVAIALSITIVMFLAGASLRDFGKILTIVVLLMCAATMVLLLKKN